MADQGLPAEHDQTGDGYRQPVQTPTLNQTLTLHAAGWIALAYLGISLLMSMLAVMFGDQRPYPEIFRDLLIASAIWTPLTVGILRQVQLRPIDRDWTGALLGRYLLIVIGATVIINATFVPLHALITGADLGLALERIATYSLYNLPVNASWAFALVVFAHLLLILEKPAALVSDESPGLNQIAVTVGRAKRLVSIADIRWVEGYGDYVRLHLGDESLLHSARLYALEKALGDCFLRVHRSALVQATHIRELRSSGSGLTVVLDDGTTIDVSRRRQAEVRRRVVEKS
jgi:DNA-binding LytR/AlgR family response regulator